MSFIFDLPKNKKKDKIRSPESSTNINAMDILAHRVNHLDKVTNNLDKNIDNIIDHVNTFIDNTENNHKDLMNKFINANSINEMQHATREDKIGKMKDQIKTIQHTNEMKHAMLEDNIGKMKDQIKNLQDTNDSLEKNIEDFAEQLEMLNYRFKIAGYVLAAVFALVFGVIFVAMF